MPIKIPLSLPARAELEAEGIAIIPEDAALRQDIRPMRIALLNLMPVKVRTEREFARLLGSTPLQVELTLLTTASYQGTNTSREHMLAFYQTFDQIKDQRFDGLVITGAPIETLPFEDVVYWRELCEILDWSQTNVTETFDICWGAQAALFHFRGVPKHEMTRKRFGIFEHTVVKPHSELLRGFDDSFRIPVSRHTENWEIDLPLSSRLEMLAKSDHAGLCLIDDPEYRHTYMFNHVEYETNNLKYEYDRDIAKGDPIHIPEHYYPDNDPARDPINTWRASAHLLFANWLNRVYKATPYDLVDLEPSPAFQSSQAATTGSQAGIEKERDHE
ncbi:MAG: homoserine O-succinyltransferase [Pseudomonadota bacterium]